MKTNKKIVRISIEKELVKAFKQKSTQTITAFVTRKIEDFLTFPNSIGKAYQTGYADAQENMFRQLKNLAKKNQIK